MSPCFMINRGIQFALVSLLIGITPAAEPTSSEVYQAVRAGTSESLKGILDRGIEVNRRDAGGGTLLISTAMYGDAQALKYLIAQGAEVNATNSAGVSALMRAAGDAEKIKLLVKHGANVNARSANGNTPLILAARARGSAKSLEVLLNAGAEINATNVFGASALMCAAAAADLESVRLLVKRGADVNAPVRGSEAAAIWGGGRSALMWAVFRGERDIARFLLHSGAEINAHEGFGSALMQAGWADRDDMARFLLKNGADVHQRDMTCDFTPLHWAAYTGDRDGTLVRTLLKHGADPNSEAGAPVDAFMGIAQTPLMWASKRGETDSVKALRSAGALETGKKRGATPTMAAKCEVNSDTLRSALAKSIAPLQETAQFSKGAFLRHSSKQDCVSCHQQYIPLTAFAFAKTAGVPVDRQIEKEVLEMVRKDDTNLFEITAQTTFHPEPAHGYGYTLLALAAQNEAPSPEIDAMVHHLLVIQGKDGQWHNNLPRPPIQSSDVGATALAIKGLKNYRLPGCAIEIERSIDRARKWLLRAKPVTNEEQAYQLLGLSWAEARPARIRKLALELSKSQRPDGGWAQLAGLESDAYATGLSLFALLGSGSVSAEDATVRRGLEFLLKTQAPDGTWHVRTRSFPFQPTMRSGFPYSRDSWISATGSSWAAMAIASALKEQPVQVSVR